MKKTLQYILIIGLFSAWGIILSNREQFHQQFVQLKDKVEEAAGINQPCTAPIKYAIGTIDPRFNISQAEFLQTIDEAQQIWSDQVGHQLFVYDPTSSFKISLIYDERQQQSDEADKLSANLNQLKTTQNQIDRQYDSLNSNYKQALDQYNSDLAKYQKAAKQYNQDVDAWNSSSRTDQSQLDDIKDEKKALDDLYAKVQKEQSQVNALAGKANNLVSKESQAVNDYNSQVTTYKEQYGATQEFEKGVYEGTGINIYQFKQLTDLRMTLIHELGHALGLGHVENSKSIMYYLMGDQDMDHPTLSAEDIAELDKVCRL